jgi:Na+-translocating ferredoxin:NAD+ oxidoreductase RnfD subunit
MQRVKNFGRYLVGMDPRIPFFFILSSYLVLGFYLLGFNRTPYQALVTTICTCALEFLFKGTFKKKWEFPLSALITSVSLSLLLNYSHNYYILVVPAFFAIGSKYLLTFNGKHAFNPAQIAVTTCLLFAGNLITSAPAYQWNGIEYLWVFMSFLGLIILHPKIQRHWLVISFLVTYTLQTWLRAWIMKHHLPFETLFLGTLTSPSFILFTFFMITDPETSPKLKKDQIKAGIILATLDLFFHLRRSYFTFFFAGSTLQGSRLFMNHFRAAKAEGVKPWFTERFYRSGYYKRVLILGSLAFLGLMSYRTFISPRIKIDNLTFSLEQKGPEITGVATKFGSVFQRVDPRIQHMIKWLLSVGDSVAIEDFDEDGEFDLFFTFPLKHDENRNSLYRGLGGFKFERVPLPMIEEKTKNIEQHGLSSSGQFVDFDNDGDKDIFITYGFGEPVLLKNVLKETGKSTFEDATASAGLNNYSNATSAAFFDANNDGLLDLIVGNTLPSYLPDYNPPQKLNFFHLPKEEYKGDERMFNFMHASWNLADNGGKNDFYLQTSPGKFEKQDSDKWGFKDTYWTLSISPADFNQDGFIDLYVANDFGPDEFYYNEGGKFFKKIKGSVFGDISNDTYKGMNSSVADIDQNGWQDVYISNVHHEMQAEGSMLWMFFPPAGMDKQPFYREMATHTGALNEDRFGWGASFADLNNDGWPDLIQTNGMVDDSIDKKYDDCPDFWYTNEKIARSAPEIHRFINKWGDVRGHCIYGKEKVRVYLNNGQKENVNRFQDVADAAGITETVNSRGAAAADLDRDGDLDFIVSNQFHAPTFYENKSSEKRNWIRIKLESLNSSCNRSAFGSRVRVIFKDRVLTQELSMPTGFMGQNPFALHFGLGQEAGPIKVEVNWCLKEKRVYDVSSINQELKLTY